MKQVYTLLLFIISITFGYSQRNISGIVLDADSKEPLIGATVFLTGSDDGTSTNSDGRFELTLLNKAESITIIYVGYDQRIIEINEQQEYIIELVPAVSILNELVVTALNLKRETKNLGYAVQKIDGQQLAEVKSPNFIDNLAGNIAGVTVNQGATGVGSTSKISIRGESSFTNNNPLFVIDGTIVSNQTTLNITNEAAAGFQEVDFGNGASDINQDDIASVTVLKGPSAAALYGNRAANGAIIITTKDGSENQNFGVSFNSSFFMDRPFQLPEFQNEYGQGNSGQFAFVDGLGGGINDNITYSWGPRLDQGNQVPQFDSPVTLSNGTIVRGGDVAVHGGAPITPTDFNSHPDNLKDFYKTGYTTINNIAISSGFDRGSFRLSFTDLQSESFIPGVNLDRKNVSARLNFNPIKSLKIGSSINYVNAQSDNRPSGGYGSENINYSLVAWGPRSLNIENLKDRWQPGLQDVQQYSFNYTFFDNPYFILNENKNAFNRDRVYGNIHATYSFDEHLSLTLQSSMDYASEFRSFRRHFSTNRFRQGAYAEHDIGYRETNSSFLVNYQTNLRSLSADFSVGGNRLDQRFENKQSQTLSLAQPGIFNFNNAATPIQIFQQDSDKRINSFYGILKLGYRDFLYVDITGRNDWSSALATPSSTDNVSFFYPSVSLSYILSKTIDLPEFISFAKLRANWAQVGNDTDPYQTSGAFLSSIPFNTQPTFTADNTIFNAGLKPEQTTAYEIGADVRFFEDRLRIDATYYNALTENQIISLPVTIASGYNQEIINGGEVRSEGIEIIAGIRLAHNEKFKWNTLINFDKNVTRVERLPSGAGKITLAYSRVYDNANQTVWFQVEEGGQIGDIFGTGYARNENGQFIIDQNGNFIADNELQKLGNYNPDFSMGVRNTFSYKNWNADILFDWQQGGQIVSRTLSLAGVGGQLVETAERPEAGIVAEGVVNTGTPSEPVWTPNTVAISAERYYRQFYDRNHEENNVYDATYLKLRQLSIGYSFRCNKARGPLKSGNNLRLSIIARNLFAWSAIPHFDPEQLAIQGNDLIRGVEDMSYPSARSIGFKLGFDF